MIVASEATKNMNRAQRRHQLRRARQHQAEVAAIRGTRASKEEHDGIRRMLAPTGGDLDLSDLEA